ncbi:hypothetical protein CRYUN_Cryun05aG0061800 [Craigia yunnanensis]
MISSSTKPPLTTPPSKRIAEAMDFEIKCWAAGKEGNMRALHHHCNRYFGLNVVGSHFHLTDLITSGSVKRVYRKATLCVHPDNVQQKGATIEQKYITEKVFDILKKGNQQGNWGIDNMHYLNYGLWKILQRSNFQSTVLMDKKLNKKMRKLSFLLILCIVEVFIAERVS